MSDLSDDSGAEKHGQARALVDKALAARREGDDDTADRLMDQARHTDPDAVEDALAAIEPGELSPDDSALGDGMADDEEVAAISRQVQPHSDAPSRSGITGSGSGADGMGIRSTGEPMIDE